MRTRDLVLIALVSIAAAVTVGVVGEVSLRLTMSVGLLVLLALVGRQLWTLDPDRQKAQSNLGTGLLVSVVVAGAVGFTQLEIDRRLNAQLRQSEQARERSAQKQTLQLTVGVQENLQGIDLRRRDLSGFYLAEKNLSGSFLRGAKLRRTNLAGADLAGADFAGADLDGADISESDMSDSTLLGASLRGADFSKADLRRANFSQADLSEAFLGDSNLRGANLHDARFNSGTEWPNGFDPAAAGAREVD